MWGSLDSQEVGLEAATLERVRNSSLGERPFADNVGGYARRRSFGMCMLCMCIGWGAFCTG